MWVLKGVGGKEDQLKRAQRNTAVCQQQEKMGKAKTRDGRKWWLERTENNGSEQGTLQLV